MSGEGFVGGQMFNDIKQPDRESLQAMWAGILL